jgi:hypothetical protein
MVTTCMPELNFDRPIKDHRRPLTTPLLLSDSKQAAETMPTPRAHMKKAYKKIVSRIQYAPNKKELTDTIRSPMRSK